MQVVLLLLLRLRIIRVPVLPALARLLLLLVPMIKRNFVGFEFQTEQQLCNLPFTNIMANTIAYTMANTMANTMMANSISNPVLNNCERDTNDDNNTAEFIKRKCFQNRAFRPTKRKIGNNYNLKKEKGQNQSCGGCAYKSIKGWQNRLKQSVSIKSLRI
jgi:hypothetical protein